MHQGCGRFKATANKLPVSMDKNRLSVSIFHGYNSIGRKRAFQALPTVNSERPFFDFAKTIKDDRGKGYPSQYENALVYIATTDLSGCFKQRDKAREFIQKSGTLFYDWISDWENFDYVNFNIDWLAWCAENLLKTIEKNTRARKKIQEAVRKQYLDGHINASAMRRYFEIFAV